MDASIKYFTQSVRAHNYFLFKGTYFLFKGTYFLFKGTYFLL